MEATLVPVKCQSDLVYLYGLVIFSRTFVKCLSHVQPVLTLLSDAGKTLKLKRWSFIAEVINCFGTVNHFDRL